MSLIDDIATRVKAATGQSTTANGVIDSVVTYLNDPANGGLQGLLTKFQSGGLGAQVQSWIGTGSNLPVTRESSRRRTARSISSAATSGAS